MILLIETFCTGNEHEAVNSEFLQIAAVKYPMEKIIFAAEKKHCECVSDFISEEVRKRVIFQYVNVVKDTGRKLKMLVSEYNIIKKIQKNSCDNIKLVMVLNSHPHTMFFVKKRFRKEKIIFIVHGNIEELEHKKNIYQLGFYIKPAFMYKRQNMKYRYIVLGRPIRDNLLMHMPFLEKQLVYVPHPYHFESLDSVSQNSGNYKIGTIGSGYLDKHSEYIFEIENFICSNNINNILLYHVGRYYNVAVPDGTSVNITGGSNVMLSTNEFHKKICQLDYIFFFFDKDSYRLTASGALCDAISHRKPVISFHNEYFDWVFKETGEIGYLCDSIDEMEQILLNIESCYKKDYEIFLRNLDHARFFFSRENVLHHMDNSDVWME